MLLPLFPLPLPAPAIITAGCQCHWRWRQLWQWLRWQRRQRRRRRVRSFSRVMFKILLIKSYILSIKLDEEGGGVVELAPRPHGGGSLFCHHHHSCRGVVSPAPCHCQGQAACGSCCDNSEEAGKRAMVGAGNSDKSRGSTRVDNNQPKGGSKDVQNITQGEQRLKQRQQLWRKEQGAAVCGLVDSDNCVDSQQRQWRGQAMGAETEAAQGQTTINQ